MQPGRKPCPALPVADKREGQEACVHLLPAWRGCLIGGDLKFFVIENEQKDLQLLVK